MRLPEKSEIEKTRLLEQQEQAKIGLRFAKQVDDVRLELIKEQNNLEKFRTETSKAVQLEIDALIAKNNGLKLENEILDRSNRLLKEPFDREWEELNQKRKKELDENVRVIEKTRIEIEQEKAQISRIRSQNDQDRVSIELRLKEASEAKEKAKNEVMQANSMLEDAKIFKAEAQSRIDAENNNLDKKAQELALKLRDIEVGESDIQM